MRHWSIRKKLMAGFAIILLAANVLCIWSAFQMRRGAATMSAIASEQLPELALATAFEREILNARINFIYHVTIQKPGTLDAGWQRFRNAQALMPRLSAQVAASAALEPLREPTRRLAGNLDQYEGLLQQILAVVADHKNSGPDFTALVAEWAASGGRLVKTAGELQSLCPDQVKQNSRDRASGLNTALQWMIGGCLFIAIAGSAIGWLLSARIGGVLLRSLGELNEAAGQLNGISTQVASSSQSLAQGASEQAASLEESSASAEEINAMAQRNSQHSHTAVELVTKSEKEFSEANQALDHVVGAMMS